MRFQGNGRPFLGKALLCLFPQPGSRSDEERKILHMGRHRNVKRGLLRDLFPGLLYSDLTKEQRRQYVRVWKARHREILRARYLVNREQENKKRRDRLNANPELRQHRRNYERRWRQTHKSALKKSYRKYRLKVEYGLSLEQFDEMIAQQHGVCAICKVKRVVRGEPHLHVDHDHQSGLVRGILCHHCNMILGHSRDSVDVLEACIAYLNRNARRECA